ncbi:MAG: hypothetical protein HC767_11075 [Akkermansiaceae bacterium]|nr:hypothetical protein [Akkermansiaceae bacterium]
MKALLSEGDRLMYMQDSVENSGNSVCILNTDTRSRATVKLNSTDVNDPPTVDTNLLSQQEEVDRMVMCYKREREYHEALRGLGFNITEVQPGFELPLEEAVCSGMSCCGVLL